MEPALAAASGGSNGDKLLALAACIDQGPDGIARKKFFNLSSLRLLHGLDIEVVKLSLHSVEDHGQRQATCTATTFRSYWKR